MPDPTPLLAPAERLADRFRSMPQSKLTRHAPSGLRLARQLAARAQRLEGLPVQELPDAGIFAVGDQLAVAAHDLAAVLADPRPAPGSTSRSRTGVGAGRAGSGGGGAGRGGGTGDRGRPARSLTARKRRRLGGCSGDCSGPA
ncbi:hypothetical protein GXW82_29085 [Streptacidiphilus sp. 4-A2]|nr:hypothetical protein [Streptacidiphilus sp. 4-A2]